MSMSTEPSCPLRIAVWDRPVAITTSASTALNEPNTSGDAELGAPLPFPCLQSLAMCPFWPHAWQIGGGWGAVPFDMTWLLAKITYLAIPTGRETAA